MALTLQVENYDASTTFTLSSRLRWGTWRTTHARGLTTDVIPLVFTGTAAAIRADIDSLEELLEDAAEFHNRLSQANSIWLRWATDGETAKRSLIYSYSLTPANSAVLTQNLEASASSYKLVIVRSRWWEAVTRTELGTGSETTKPDASTRLDYSAKGSGNLPDRIAYIRGLVSGVSYTLSKAWIGIKPATVSLTNFDPVWELDDIMGTDTSKIALAAASGGYYASCDFSTTTGMATRVTSRMAVHSSTDMAAHAGEYIVLLKYRLSDVGNTTVGLRMRTLYYGSSNAYLWSSRTQYIPANGGNWDLLEIGRLTLPHNYRQVIRDTTPDSSNFAFQVEASRLAGTGTLDLDCLILLPAEHYLSLDGFIIGNGEYLTVYTDELGQVTAYVREDFVNNYITGGIAVTSPAEKWRFPAEGGVVVFAGNSLELNFVQWLDFEVNARVLSYNT